MVDDVISTEVGLIHLNQYDSFIIDLLPSNEGRSTITKRLIENYFKILYDQEYDEFYSDFANLSIVGYTKGTPQDLKVYHDPWYVDLLFRDRDCDLQEGVDMNPFSSLQSKILKNLKILENRSNKHSNKNHKMRLNEDSNDDEKLQQELKISGLLYDCPIFPRLDEYVELVSSTTKAITKWVIDNHKLNNNTHHIGLSWSGGRHHAHKSKASGFCYLNDIVLAILLLRRCFTRVMYIDLDLHHGDGVSAAFKFSDKVLCVSVHRYEPGNGFFPGSGGDIVDGEGKGYGYNINLPLKKGLKDDKLLWIVKNVIIPKIDQFKPQAVVVQCGGDGLCSDLDFKEWNLTVRGYGLAIKSLIQKLTHDRTPCIMLGGGGYNSLETAKLWTYITGICLGIENKFEENEEFEELPDLRSTDEMLEDICDFQDQITFFQNETPRNSPDLNTTEYLLQLRARILK